MGSRHEEYYFDDGNVIFLVEGVLFKVHRYYFKRDSEMFRSLFDCPTPLDEEEGATDDKPIHLEQMSSKDFEDLLWVYYFSATATANPEKPYPYKNWIGAVRIAREYDFNSVIGRAMVELLQCKDPGVQIAAARAAGDAPGAEKLLSWGFVQIAACRDGVWPAEANLMGLADTVNVSRFLIDVSVSMGFRILTNKLDVDTFSLTDVPVRYTNLSGRTLETQQDLGLAFARCKDYYDNP